MKEVKYHRIGRGYNQTRKADPYLTSRMKHYLNLQKEGVYLEIGCGTGNYTNALSEDTFHFIGIDPSEEMLSKARESNGRIDWRRGEAARTDLEDASVDGVLASLTIHHWPTLKPAFNELYRVLRPEGKMVIFTSTPEQMEAYWLNHYFPSMMAAAVRQMPSFEKLRAAMEASGFKISATEKYFVSNELQDLFLQSGKHRPELYLRPEIRKGISTFADLANATEVEAGLQKLKQDIETGMVDDIINNYESEAGDYLFVAGRKA